MSRPPFPELGPHLVTAPPPWREERDLPFDPELSPGAIACRKCARVDSALEAELIAAYQSVQELEDLMVWLGEEHELGSQWREEAEREVELMRGLLHEFETLASVHETALVSARRAVLVARKKRQAAEQAVEQERARAARLTTEIKRLKKERVTASPRKEAASAEDLVALAYAASEVGEIDGRVLALESELKKERLRVARYARYVEALEQRLRRLAETGEQDASRREAPIPHEPWVATSGTR